MRWILDPPERREGPGRVMVAWWESGCQGEFAFWGQRVSLWKTPPSRWVGGVRVPKRRGVANKGVRGYPPCVE